MKSMKYEENTMANALGNNRILLRDQEIQGVKFAFVFARRMLIRCLNKENNLGKSIGHLTS